ncbi:MAG: paraquat-inducible protein A [Betaproteobacteria bacterium]
MTVDRNPELNDTFLASTVACPDCDMLQTIVPLPPGGRARCSRCGRLLARHPPGPEDLPLAFAVAALILFVIANTSPLMDLSVLGRTASTTIVGGALEMWREGQVLTSALITFCVVLAPGGYILFMLTLLVTARRSPLPHWVGGMLRWVHYFEAWSMLEVMMLGILVALIKIAQLATVEAGIGMYAVGILILLFPAIYVTFDPRELWRRLQWYDGEMPPLAAAEASIAAATKSP